MKYEMVMVVASTIDQKEAETKYRTLLESEGFTVDEVDNWGKKPTAYPIKKQKEAIYLFYQLSSPPENVKKLEARFRLDDNLLRHLILKKIQSAKVKKQNNSVK